MICECSDPNCPFCKGNCSKTATDTLYRIDMEDTTGVTFCMDCANDAIEAGVFTDSISDD